MKPGKRGEQEEDPGELGRSWTKPVQCHLVDNSCHSAAGENTQNNERQVGIMKHDIKQSAGTDIQEISWWMRLVDARIKTLHRQRKIHGIHIVEIMTPKREASDGNRARQKHEGQLLPINHTKN